MGQAAGPLWALAGRTELPIQFSVAVKHPHSGLGQTRVLILDEDLDVELSRQVEEGGRVLTTWEGLRGA